jgi:hypothetical protein
MELTDTGMVDEEAPTYKPSEIKLMKKMAEIDPIEIVANLEGYSVSDDRVETLAPKFEGFDKILKPEDLSQYPILDLSDKEKKFINKYCDEVMCYDDGQVVNLKELISTAKMTWFRFNINGEDNNTLWHAEIDADKDVCRMYIIQTLDNYIVHISADLEKIEEYNVVNNLLVVRKNLIIKNPEKLLTNQIDALNVSELCTWDCVNIMKVVEYILRVMVVMKDRPQRTKIVKCTERRKVYKNPKNPKQGYVEKEFVIHRLLKATPDAKEYVKKMSESGERHFEYVVEEWERRAHTRQLKSGKIIYIGETTCHRHKDLTNKEIHIKL